MVEYTICCAGTTPAAEYARRFLTEYGFRVTHTPSDQVTHLLLDVPSFTSNGALRLGGDVRTLLDQLPDDVAIFGGNLSHPALAAYRTRDFLLDEEYLALNADLTAQCALDVALPYLGVSLRQLPVLILGWGRIGKCLAKLFRSLEAEVTVAARNPADRAMLRALGFRTADFSSLTQSLEQARLIFNTVPAHVLDMAQMAACRKDCVKIELASRDGISGEDIIVARGLPGIHLPESSGELIAKTFLRLWKGA